MNKKIWVIKVDTESCDHGFSGYFISKPTKSQINNYLREFWTDDFAAGTAYADVIDLVPQVKS